MPITTPPSEYNYSDFIRGHVSNTAFQRVLEKADFTKEGILRKALFVRGKWTDGFMYSILREE